jgi:co-chaperonin GroES (HSP10)
VPLLDRVLVQRIKAETKTATGIFLPESAVKELNEAKVLAVGPGGLDKDGKRTPMGVATGDRVLIPQVSGSRSGGVAIAEEDNCSAGLLDLRSRLDGLFWTELTSFSLVWRITSQGWRGRVPPLQG